MEDSAPENGEKSPLIFPPINHENLHISTLQNHNLQSLTYPSPISTTDTSSTTSSSSFSPWDDTSPPSSPIKNFNNSPKFQNWAWLNLGLGLFSDKVSVFVKFLRNFGFVRGVFLIFRYPIAPLLVFLYFRWRRNGGDQHFLRVIREKDERIKELLNQIARMNEVLLSMHKVPSSNVG